MFNRRPPASPAVIIWVVFMVLVIGVLVVAISGCGQAPKEAPLSKIAGANPNCFRNCTSSLTEVDTKAGTAPVTTTLTGTRTNTETVNQ